VIFCCLFSSDRAAVNEFVSNRCRYLRCRISVAIVGASLVVAAERLSSPPDFWSPSPECL
jgi:hypothetical protein